MDKTEELKKIADLEARADRIHERLEKIQELLTIVKYDCEILIVQAREFDEWNKNRPTVPTWTEAMDQIAEYRSNLYEERN